MSSVLALVPARGGSKELPRKNLETVGGTPLVGLAVEVALAAGSVDRVVVSTDDDEIAAVAERHGAEVPFRRPAELATHDVGDFPVAAHALAWLDEHEGYRPELLVWLRPTCPLRTAADVEGAVALLRESGADCVRSVCPSEHHPYWMKQLDGDRLRPFLPDADERDYPRRQLLPPVYRLNGAVDAVRVASAIAAGELFPGDMRGFVMPAGRSFDVDTATDLAVVRALWEGRA